MPMAASLRSTVPIAAVSAAFEPGGRLVERQYARAGPQARARSRPAVCRHARAHPRADRAHRDSRQRRAGFRRSAASSPLLPRGKERGGAEPAAPQRDQHVVDDRQALEQPACLIGARDPDPRNLMSTQLRDGLIAELHRARIRAIEAADDVERGGLAGAVRADDAGDRTRRARRSSNRCTACTPPKLTERLRTESPLAAGAGREEAADVASLFCEPFRGSFPGRSSRSTPTKPTGASRSTTSIKTPTNSSRYWPSVASSSGSSTTTQAPTSDRAGDRRRRA